MLPVKGDSTFVKSKLMKTSAFFLEDSFSVFFFFFFKEACYSFLQKDKSDELALFSHLRLG